MECYEGVTMTIKTFRGNLADETQDRLNLHTVDGKIGYKIIKFELMPGDPLNTNSESICKIYTNKQSTIDATLNFSDLDLLAAGVLNNSDSYNYNPGAIIVFDGVKFNQDVYITNANGAGTGNEAVNYYLELETVKLSDTETTMATLQSIRSRYESYTPAGPT